MPVGIYFEYNCVVKVKRSRLKLLRVMNLSIGNTTRYVAIFLSHSSLDGGRMSSGIH